MYLDLVQYIRTEGEGKHIFVTIDVGTVLVLSKLKKINETASQPQRNATQRFQVFCDIKDRCTYSYSASHQAPNYVQRS